MRLVYLRVWLLLLVVLLVGFYPARARADGPIVLVSPTGSVAVGQSLAFRLRAEGLTPPLQAVLNYRAIGTLPFRSVPMSKDTEIEFSAILAGSQLLPPGIEYYFAVADGHQQLFTLPQQNPQQQPLKIDLDLGPVTELLLPAMDGARIVAKQASLVIELEAAGVPADWSAMRLTVDNVDVTQVSVTDGSSLRYLPETPFPHGRHSVTLEAMDGAGNLLEPQYWSFILPMTDLIDSATAQAQIDVEASALVLEPENGSETDWKIQSNLSLATQLETGNFRASFEANGWYLEQEGPEATEDNFNLNSYLLMFEYGEQRLSIGDLQIEGTELLGESIARRGGLLELNYANTSLQGFLLRSNAVTGTDNISGMDNPDQRLYGGSLRQVLIDNDGLVFKGTAIAGKNALPEDYNSGSLVGGNEGEIYSVQLTSRLFDERLDLSGEYSSSHFDADLSDPGEKVWDNAWRFRLAGHEDWFDYGGGYKYLGQNFYSIVTPSAAANFEEYNLYGTKSYEQSSLTANLLHIRDNADHDPMQALVRTSNLNVTYSLYKPDWPVFFINAVLGLQDSTDEPSGWYGLKNRTETIGGGFTLTRDSWNLVPSYYFTRFEDESIADSDSQTHQFMLSLGLLPHESISLSPSLSYSRMTDETSSVVNETWQGVLAGVFTFSTTQNLNITLSGINNRADDGSFHTISTDMIGQYNWLLETRFWEKLQKTISVRGRYNRVNDRVQSSVAEDYSVYLLLSFGGSPLQLL